MLKRAAWTSLLGLPLDKALDEVRSWGLEAPTVLTTCAPRRRNETGEPEQETLRVIRVREGELTVSAFRDGEPHSI